MSDFIQRLKQRKLVQWAAAYVAAAWALLQVLDLAADSYGWPKVIMHLAFVAMALGLVVTVLLAWYHGERGVQRVTGVELLLLAGVFAIGGFLLWREARVMPAPAAPVASNAPVNAASVAAVATPPAVPIPARSIAVLPFANLSGDKGQDYFSDGISEDLLNLLARIPQLQVTARTSSFWFRGKDFTIPQIARKLRVAYVLEGSVQKAGDQVRISVQLVDAASDTQRWSQTYDRPFRDVFKIQDEIGADVVKQLRVQLLGDAPKTREIDLRAYNLVLNARNIAYQNSAEALKQSNALLHQALAIDPKATVAWVALASNAMKLARVDGRFLEHAAEARKLVGKAIAIDPDDAAAQALLASLAMNDAFDLPAAAAHLKRALAKGPPDADVMVSVAGFLFMIDRPEASVAWYRQAMLRDPYNTAVYGGITDPLMQLGRFDEAIRMGRKLVQLAPYTPGTHASIAWALMGKGRMDEAWAEYRKEVSNILRQSMEPSLLCRSGRKAEGERALKRMEKLGPAGLIPTATASSYADCGDPGRAFQWLNRSKGDGGLKYVVYGISFKPYHDDPRWRAFLDKTIFAPARLARIDFDVPLPRQAPSPAVESSVASP